MTSPAPHGGRDLRVLHVSPFFYPASLWGGPIFSTKAICDGVAAKPGVSVRVLTTDAAGPAPDQVLDVGPSREMEMNGYTVRYERRSFAHSGSPGLLRRLPGLVRWADVVHLTFTYSFPTLPTLSLCRLFGKPVVWSPRGALQATEEWKDAPRRGVKTAWEAVADRVRPARTVLHVTAEQEREMSSRRLPSLRTVLIPNGVEVPRELPPRPERSDGRLRLVFLSRIHPKKGLDILLDAMERLPPTVDLDIYGTGDDAYVRNLAARVAAMRGGQRIRLMGHVDGAGRDEAYDSADIFVLPSFSENFGNVIAEALARGVPVLTTTATPWAGLVEHDCGAWVEPEVGAVADGITRLARSDLRAMGRRGREWMQREYSAESTANAFHDLYLSLAAEGRNGDSR